MYRFNNYLNMVKEIAKTDLKLRYQGSFFGYLWTLLKPLFLFLVMYFVFTKFLRVGGNIPHYPIYLLLGIVIWTFFSEVTAICMGSIVGKGDLIRKVYFPRIILVISNSLTSFIVFILNLVIVFIFMAFNHIKINLNAVFFPVLLIELYVFCLGISLFLSSLYVKFRDIAHIWEVLLQALFYGSAILYPLSMVPKPFSEIISLNPLVQIIQDSRYLLISGQTSRVGNILPGYLGLVPYLLPFLIFLLGYLVFNKMSAKFAEEI